MFYTVRRIFTFLIAVLLLSTSVNTVFAMQNSERAAKRQRCHEISSPKFSSVLNLFLKHGKGFIFEHLLLFLSENDWLAVGAVNSSLGHCLFSQSSRSLRLSLYQESQVRFLRRCKTEFDACVNGRNTRGETILYNAVLEQDLPLVQQVLRLPGIHVMQLSRIGSFDETVLHLAAFMRENAILRELLNHQTADVAMCAGFRHGTALHTAAQNGNVDGMKVILRHLESQVRMLAVDGTMLGWSHQGCLRARDILVCLDNEGHTAHAIARMRGHQELAGLLHQVLRGLRQILNAH